MPIHEKKEKGICDYCPDSSPDSNSHIQEVMSVELPHLGQVKICRRCINRLGYKIVYEQMKKKKIGATH
jgi:hypothetical protein